MTLLPGRYRTIIIIAIAAVIAGLVVLYGSVNPANHIFPRCPFLLLTGLQCPGCGSQRAIHALLHGDIAAAWDVNALLVVMIPVIITLFIASLRRNRAPHFYRAANSALVIRTLLLIIICWWVGRNIW